MIIGMGVDICMISRIEGILTRHGENFLKRVFTERECAYVEKFKGGARLGGYAKRWAAKEAFVKALGTGFIEGILFRDIEIIHDVHGAPKIELSGGVKGILEKKLSQDQKAEILVSLSDDPPFALAQVLIQIFPL